MNKLTAKILGAIFMIGALYSCDKVNPEDIPSNIELTDDVYEVEQGKSVEVDFLANDVLEAEELTISLINDVSQGELNIIENSTKYLYTANFDFSGTETFNYEVCSGNDCKVGLVTINITAIPDSCQPTVTDDYYTAKDAGFSTSVTALLANDENNCNEWDLSSFKITKQPAFGVVQQIGEEITFSAFNEDWRKDQFSYKICGTDGNCKTAAVIITNGDIVAETQL